MSASPRSDDIDWGEATDWGDVENLVRRLSAQIATACFLPDVILAIARGGWIPVRLLSRELGVKRIASIGVEYSDPERITPTLYSAPDVPGNCGAILVVEDRVETGRAMIAGVNHLRTLNATLDIRTACIFHRTDSLLTPDFTLGVRDDTIRFPWE